ncbi:hypothetical protein [Streptomyces afghaniensis]|uniref:hypothetical protein n=1 Tax=Streptomyces afghaniensis TaxID=66865 RepID=UPI0037A4BA89
MTTDTQDETAAHARYTFRLRVSAGAARANIAQAVERQTAAMRELSRRAFPESDTVADDAPAMIEQAHVRRRRPAPGTRGEGRSPAPLSSR